MLDQLDKSMCTIPSGNKSKVTVVFGGRGQNRCFSEKPLSRADKNIVSLFLRKGTSYADVEAKTHSVRA